MNFATLFPHRRPAATLIAILGSSTRPSSTVEPCPDGFMRLQSHPSLRVANWRHHEVDETKKETERERRRNEGSETENGKQGFGSYTHSCCFRHREYGCYDNWCNFCQTDLWKMSQSCFSLLQVSWKVTSSLHCVCVLELMNIYNPEDIFLLTLFLP